MTKQELIERLADAEHASWAHWMDYLFSKGRFNSDGSFTIEAEAVGRWKRQSMTLYADLTDGEQQSDRDEVHKIIPIIETYAR